MAKLPLFTATELKNIFNGLNPDEIEKLLNAFFPADSDGRTSTAERLTSVLKELGRLTPTNLKFLARHFERCGQTGVTRGLYKFLAERFGDQRSLRAYFVRHTYIDELVAAGIQPTEKEKAIMRRRGERLFRLYGSDFPCVEKVLEIFVFVNHNDGLKMIKEAAIRSGKLGLAEQANRGSLTPAEYERVAENTPDTEDFIVAVRSSEVGSNAKEALLCDFARHSSFYGKIRRAQLELGIPGSAQIFRAILDHVSITDVEDEVDLWWRWSQVDTCHEELMEAYRKARNYFVRVDIKKAEKYAGWSGQPLTPDEYASYMLAFANDERPFHRDQAAYAKRKLAVLISEMNKKA